MANNKLFTGTILSILLILLFSLISFGCSYTNYDVSDLKVIHEKTFNTAPGKSLTLKAYSGDVFITTSDEPTVYVRILGNSRAKEKVQFKFENTDDGVSITTERPGGWNFFSFGKGIKLRFEIRLPRNYNAEISSSGGDISIKDLDGTKDLKSSGGDISLENSTGSLYVSTSGGDIQLNNISGEENLKTSGGDITSTGFKGNLTASTSGGDISLNGSDGKIDAGTSGGQIKLIYQGDNLGISLSSSGGDISVKLPADFNAHADLHASGGSISCGFKTSNVTKVSSSNYEADFNNGGSTLYVKTSGGDIDISQQ